MGLNKRSRIKHMLLFFGLPVIGSVAGNAVYEHLITPAIPFLPKVPFTLYSIFATAFAVLFLLGLVAAIGQLLANGWKHLTTKDLRNIFLVVFTPMMLIFFVMMVRWAFEAYKDMKQRWVSGTRRERFTFAGVAAFVLVAWEFMMAGELAGWDDLLWMNST